MPRQSDVQYVGNCTFLSHFESPVYGCRSQVKHCVEIITAKKKKDNEQKFIQNTRFKYINLKTL